MRIHYERAFIGRLQHEQELNIAEISLKFVVFTVWRKCVTPTTATGERIKQYGFYMQLCISPITCI